MTQTLVKREQSRLAAISGFTDAEIALMEQTVAPGVSRLELAFFLVNARRLGLDPILRQIYLIKYAKDSPAEIVVGIDGYRARAEQSEVYAGSDDPVYAYDEKVDVEGAPSKATVTVWKIVAGQRVPFTASARWKEFYPGSGKVGEQYRKRPHNQLAIRAESHALRKGFPQQTQALEAHVEPPREWIEAVQADQDRRDDPEATRRNSQRYDEIFGKEDRQLNAPASSRRALLEENRRLVAKARELGVQGLPPVVGPGNPSDSAIAAANADLSERIRIAEAALGPDDEEESESQEEMI